LLPSYPIIVSIGQSTNNSSHVYYFGQSISDTFVNTPFSTSPPQYFGDIGAIADFWQWLQGPLIDGLYTQEWHSLADYNQNATEFLPSGHRIIGNVRLQQIVSISWVL
jgi:hypothetical protein